MMAFLLTPVAIVQGTVHASTAEVVHLNVILYNVSLDETIHCAEPNLAPPEVDACSHVPPVNLTVPVDPLTNKPMGIIWFASSSIPTPVVYPASCGEQCQQCGYPDGCYTEGAHKTSGVTVYSGGSSGGSGGSSGGGSSGSESTSYCDWSGCYASCGGYGPDVANCQQATDQEITISDLGFYYGDANTPDATNGVIHAYALAPSTLSKDVSVHNGADDKCVADKYGDGIYSTGVSGQFTVDPCSGGVGPEGSGYWGVYIRGYPTS